MIALRTLVSALVAMLVAEVLFFRAD